MASLLFVAALSLPLIACEDTRARQENEQLKAHVAELVKDNGNLGNQVEALTQENIALKDNERLKAKKTQTKGSKTKHHRHTAKRAATSPN